MLFKHEKTKKRWSLRLPKAKSYVVEKKGIFTSGAIDEDKTLDFQKDEMLMNQFYKTMPM